jgi:GntR family transcriptional regulator
VILVVTPTGPPPTEQIRDQLRGLVAAGRLAAGERLPSVRQLAADLGVAPGTVAKAYRALEAEGIVTTSVGAGTRVSSTVSSPPVPVVEAARRLADASRGVGIDVDEAVRLVRAVWPDDAG